MTQSPSGPKLKTTPEQRRRMLALAKAATPGPWIATEYPPHQSWLKTAWGAPVAHFNARKRRWMHKADSLFCDHARDFAPTAAHDVETLLELLRKCDEAINPSDKNGLSIPKWNDRLNAATAEIHAVLESQEES